ncbi:MAG: putative quinol monooxygenase [Dehalococcoidia bacterium]
MFGTVAVLKPKPGQEQAVLAHFDHWWKDRAPQTPGALLGTLNRETDNPNELLLSVVFSSQKAYEDNANNPEQDKWYRELVAMLESEPQWIDGQVLGVHCRGAL